MDLSAFKNEELKIPVSVNTAGGEAEAMADSYKAYLDSNSYPGFSLVPDLTRFVLDVGENSMDQYNR